MGCWPACPCLFIQRRLRWCGRCIAGVWSYGVGWAEEEEEEEEEIGKDWGG